ncbi:pyridoxal 5'-phosphate synthase [Methylopila sp. M107]|uniref:pyridoxine/pyridoxamine 5'-phosphate oxidase n=1 Tax=Methylopila sp. M107 TaxID=1101190 RepID=UPI0018CBA7B1|nr:pyridoxal 5'-phosphate synthase [Methylopila sp. M107]
MREDLRGLASLQGPFPTFDPDAAPDAPLPLFLDWLGAALKAGIAEAHAMTLSTVDQDGHPDARVLILKNVDEDGWHFATTRTGPKGRQIFSNPHVAMTFYWQPLGRQVRIRGIGFDVGAAARDEDFRARTFEARARGLIGRQSEVLPDESLLDAGVVEQTARLKDDPRLVPANWGVYAVRASEIEFWQAREDRLHTRLRYRQAGESGRWVRERLWP